MIEKIGGTGKNYVVNGEQLAPCKKGDDGFWGRVELSPKPGRETDDLLNVFFVTDADKTPDLPATAVETDGIKGAVIGNVAALFVTDAKRQKTAFTFLLPAAARPLTCYVSGVAAGTWTVSVAPSSAAPSDAPTAAQPAAKPSAATITAVATEAGGLLTFTTPASETVTLTPAENT